jgi:hypothetical protein
MLVLILASLPACVAAASSAAKNGTSSEMRPASSSIANGLNGAASTTAEPVARSRLSKYPSSLQAVYVAASDPFPEVETFVTSSAAAYHLDVKRYKLPMRQAMAAYLHDSPSIKAVFVGTRRADPHGEKLKHFDPTDHGWPDFMRVHPVIDWHYTEIWSVRCTSLDQLERKRVSVGWHRCGMADNRAVPTITRDTTVQAVRAGLHVAGQHQGHISEPGTSVGGARRKIQASMGPYR